MNQLHQCRTCQRHYFADAFQLANGISRWACPFCGQVSDFAANQMSQPGISEGAQTFWGVVSGIAIIAGLFVAAHMADRTIEQLTA